MRERLPAQTFRLPIEKIRAGYKTDRYFNRTKDILTRDNHYPQVTMQLFQKVEGATVCGVDHAIAILHAGTGFYESSERAEKLFERYLELEKKAYGMWLNIRNTNWGEYEKIGREIFGTSRELDMLWTNTFPDLSINTLNDGDSAGSRETVMLIEGNLRDFVHLETLYLGALTDETCVATNTRRITEAAGDTPILMFGARHKSHESQTGDGYAAYIGGVTSVSTMEQGEYWGSEAIGTIPHALIASYRGDTVLATLKFDEHINRGDEHVANVVSLVDFENDSVSTSLAVAKALKGRLWGVRLDTSENMTDLSVFLDTQEKAHRAESQTQGVNPKLVFLVREALDKAGFNQVKIVASGGFNADKITRFKKLGVPVDVFGVGSALYEGSGGKFDYTADVVRPAVKKGREYKPNPRLETIDVWNYTEQAKMKSK